MPPTTRTAKSRYTATAWGGEVHHDLTVPSGQLCLCKRPGVQGLIKAGLIDDLDALTSLVDQKHVSRVKGKPTVNTQALMKDPQSIMRVLELADRVVAHVVVEPSVQLPPENDADRVKGQVYTDMIDEEDKMFIMNWAMGGQADLESFRRERGQLAGLVGDGADLPEDTK